MLIQQGIQLAVQKLILNLLTAFKMMMTDAEANCSLLVSFENIMVQALHAVYIRQHLVYCLDPLLRLISLHDVS